MAETVNVRSIAALRHFRAEFCTFAEEARNALSSVEMEVRRTRDWLERQQLPYWLAQVKRGNENVNEARTALHRKRISQSGSDAISDSDQKEMLRVAQKQLRDAEEKVRTVKHWIPILEHAIAEYHALSQPLGDRLQGDVEHALAVLDRMATALEAYVALAPPPSARTAFAGLEPTKAAPAPTAAASASASASAAAEADSATVPAQEPAPAEGTGQTGEPGEAAAVGANGSQPAAAANAETSKVGPT
jgi:hypothetical protein